MFILKQKFIKFLFVNNNNYYYFHRSIRKILNSNKKNLHKLEI
jgi:hypothetical protein